MSIRKPVVAGQFYPGQRDACLAEVQACIVEAALPASLQRPIVAGIVPHAGWTFSGALAALVFAAIKQQAGDVETVVICGAAHGYMGPQAAVDDSEAWETPLGRIAIDETLRARLLTNDAVARDGASHRQEHSIEVQVPFVQQLFPEARLLPIIVPPLAGAVDLGDALAEAVQQTGTKVVYVGSTDLTHYGPRYGFTPKGGGAEGTRWAHEENDRAFIDLALRVQPEKLLHQAVTNLSACGPGAAAATLAAVRQLGVGKGLLLAHTNSNEVMRRKMGRTGRDSVGYAALVF